MKKTKMIPYFKSCEKFSDQVTNSSKRKSKNKFLFLFKRMRNYLCERIAYNSPVNSIRVKMHRIRGVNIGKNVNIGRQCVIDSAYPEYIYLRDNSSLSGGVTLLAHSNPYECFKGKLLSYVSPIEIKENAWIGINATILPGVTIGKGSMVSAGAIVSESVPNDCVVAGNPAKIIKKFPQI